MPLLFSFYCVLAMRQRLLANMAARKQCTIDASWTSKALTILTRLYAGNPFSSIGFILAHDEAYLSQHEAWVNSKANPVVQLLQFPLQRRA